MKSNARTACVPWKVVPDGVWPWWVPSSLFLHTSPLWTGVSCNLEELAPCVSLPCSDWETHCRTWDTFTGKTKWSWLQNEKINLQDTVLTKNTNLWSVCKPENAKKSACFWKWYALIMHWSSPATRETRVRFPTNANGFLNEIYWMKLFIFVTIKLILLDSISYVSILF